MVINSILSTGESRVVLAIEAPERGCAVAVVEGESLRHLYARTGKNLTVVDGRVSCGGSGFVPATVRVLSVAEEAAYWSSPRR